MSPRSVTSCFGALVVLAGCGEPQPDLDGTVDAGLDASVDADPTFSEDCERTFDEAGWLHLEPALDGPALVLQLLRGGDEAVFPLQGSCIIVRPYVDGALLDAAFDDAYWNATLGRMPGEGVWVLDPTPTEPTNAPALGLGVRSIPASSFPSGLELAFAFPVVPASAHVTAYYNPQDAETEPDWVLSSARPILTRHYDFSTKTLTPIEPHPFSWVFTRLGHHFVRVTATITPTVGPPLTATNHVHFVVVDEPDKE